MARRKPSYSADGDGMVLPFGERDMRVGPGALGLWFPTGTPHLLKYPGFMRIAKRLPIRLNWAQEQPHSKSIQRNGLNKFRFQPQLVLAEDNVARLAGHEGNTNIITVLGKGEPSGTT
jgi:hypothetical protein